MENNVYSQHVHRRENLRDKLSAAATHHGSERVGGARLLSDDGSSDSVSASSSTIPRSRAPAGAVNGAEP